MNISQLKKELGLKNAQIAGFFELSPIGYANSSAKERYEQALCMFYQHVKKNHTVITKCPYCAAEEEFSDEF